MIIQIDPLWLLWAFGGLAYAFTLTLVIKGAIFASSILAQRLAMRNVMAQLEQINKISEEMAGKVEAASKSLQVSKGYVEDAVKLAKQSKVVIIRVDDAAHVLCQEGKVVHLKQGGRA